MFKHFLQKNKSTQSGFTILVAVVTAGILLIIAMTIGGIALKEQVLSTANKESQVAFYAADTGMECALYWDQKKGKFAPDDDGNPPSLTVSGIKCNNINNNDITTGTVDHETSVSGLITYNTYSYSFKIDGLPVGVGGVPTCAVVRVIKSTNDNRTINGSEVARVSSKIYTDIYSYGYNTCQASLRRLERGIEAHYSSVYN